MTEPVSPLVARVRNRRGLPPPAMRRAIREAAGASLGALAQEIGCTRQAVHRWEQGTREPRGELLDAYAGLLRALQEELAAK